MKISPQAKIVLLLLTGLLAWNFFLPAAENMYNNPSRSSYTPEGDNVDFFVYYIAGSRLLDGDNPYFFGRDPQGNPVISDYHYPPVFLPIFSLFARLEFDWARFLWLVLYTLSYLAILAAMARRQPDGWAMPFLALSLMLSLLAYPLLGHILTGQADVFVMVLLVGSYLGYAAKQRLLSAVLLALGTALKVSPVFLLVYFVLFFRDFRYLLFYLASLAAISALALFFVPLSYYADYVFRVLPALSAGTDMSLSQSLVSYFSFSPLLSMLISIFGLVGLAGLDWLIGNPRLPAGREAMLPLAGDHFRSELVFILNLGWVLIFHSGAWPYTYVWLILPSAWLLVGLIRHQVKPGYLAVVALGVLLLLAKDYGIPGLTKLNLWGNLILSVTLIVGSLKKGSFSSAPGTA